MPTRSNFISTTGALLLVAGAHGCANPHGPDASPTSGTLAPLAWLRVTPRDRVEILVSKSEMGQGVATGFATIVADELDARLDQLDIVFPACDETFDDPVLHTSLTGGSFSIANMYPALRRAGATARAMLLAAAAKKWEVHASLCGVRDGVVTGPGGRSATFGSLASDAAALPVPATVLFKSRAQHTYVGRHVPRLDIPAKVDGSAKFGIDVVVPGMRYATVVHPPSFGASPGTIDDRAARRTAGVRDVFPIEGGIAVVGDTTWSAFSGARALEVGWKQPSHAIDSEALLAEAAELANDAGKRRTARRVGDARIRGAKTLQASYTGPFLAHAAMEPMNATAIVAGGRCVVYAPTQVQTAARALAAKAAGVPIDAVEVHTTYLGGGFGRRLHADYVREAVEIAKRHGTPIKLTWTREEDLQHDYYRPMFHSAIRGELDGAGRLVALEQTIVSPSTFRLAMPEYSAGKIDGEYFAGVKASWPLVSGLFLHGVDVESVDGAADSPYAFPNLLVSYVEHETGVPVGDMRAPEASWNTFVLETFLDECAHAAKRDAVELRRELLAQSPRGKAVLERAVSMARSATRLPHERALGVAFAFWQGSYAATVADVSLAGNVPRVHRLWVAADIGRVINPDNVKAQLEGGSVFGLSMALACKITLKNGRVEQSNFDDYPLPRMADAPAIEAVALDSDAEPTGVGELGVPGVAPAVANALFKLTGRRMRSLPFTDALAYESRRSGRSADRARIG